MSEKTDRLHREACEKKETVYKDPDTGYLVMTRYFLESRGYCCLSGCRHCPYGYPEGGHSRDPRS